MAADSRLFVGNLTDQVTEDLLYELFLQVGPVEKVIRPNRNGQLAKFAFVDFTHPESVNYAIQVIKGVKLFGEELWLKGPSDSKNSCVPPVSRSPSHDRTRNSYIQPASRSPSRDRSHRTQSSVSPGSSQGSHTSTRGRPEPASGSRCITAVPSLCSQDQSSSRSRDRSHHKDRSHQSPRGSCHSPGRSHRPDRPNLHPDRSRDRHKRSRRSRDQSHHDRCRDRSHHKQSHRDRSCHGNDQSRNEEDRKQRILPSSPTACSSEQVTNKDEKCDITGNELRRFQPVHCLQKEQPHVPYSTHEMGPQGDHPPCLLQNFPTNTGKQLNNQDFLKKTAIYRWSASDKKQ